ncbi:MAG: serine protein kinase RIO [Candidatus Bathyarchaeota archaeon]|nr:serine protein kinase RIO [Candidatus Bathyarchaeota archaeon]
MSKKIQEKLEHKEKLAEKRDRMLRHDFSAERAVFEEVFDQATLMVIYDFLNNGILYELHGVVNAGKEARVYWGKDKDGNDLAVKIYLTTAAEFRKGRLKYIEGDHRFKNVKRDTRSLVFAWAQKEFKNLEQAYNAKVRVPKPIAVKDNVLVMEFIGKGGVNAPSLKEHPPSNAEKVYKLLLTYLHRLYCKADLVHGDLSEYNIMLWKGKPVIIDMAQAVPTSHPMAQFFLNRDIENINRFFVRLGVEVLSTGEIYKRIVG